MFSTPKPMTLDDLAEVSALGIASKGTWGYTVEQMAVFARELTIGEDDLAELLAAEVVCEAERIVGYFTIKRHSDGTTELEHLFVAPDAFGRGIGRQLLQRAVAVAAEHDTESLTIIADPNSAGFYEKHGAVRVGDHESSISGRTIPVLEIPTATVQND